jgi:alpha-beta hydrolase superfamily lysophospholipase
MVVHSFLDDRDTWKTVLSELAAPGFETEVLDLAGFGRRAEAHGPFTFDRLAAGLFAVLDTVGKPFVLVGHSMAAPVVELVAGKRD